MKGLEKKNCVRVNLSKNIPSLSDCFRVCVHEQDFHKKPAKTENRAFMIALASDSCRHAITGRLPLHHERLALQRDVLSQRNT